MRYALAAVILVASLGSAQAAEPYEGSWAARYADCDAPTDGNIRIIGNMLYEHEGACTIDKSAQYSLTYALFLSCKGEGSTWRKVMAVAPLERTMRVGENGERTLYRCGNSARPPNWPR